MHVCKHPTGLAVNVWLARVKPLLNAALTQRDTHTASHYSRVGKLAVALASRRGFSDEELVIIGVAGRMHDVGKIGIPDAILRKAGAVNVEEWAIMRSYSVRGESIIRTDRALAQRNAIALVIRHHHEHFDGSGYPDGLSGDAIPLAARLLSVVDSYDVMTESRAYHRVRSHRETMTVLETERGTRHAPRMVDLIQSCDESWLMQIQRVKIAWPRWAKSVSMQELSPVSYWRARRSGSRRRQ